MTSVGNIQQAESLTPPSPSSVRLPTGTGLLAALLLVVAFLCTLGASPLLEPDEARYGEIAREMLVRGDWVTPTLNFVKYFEKPPLLYWLTAFNLWLFGQHDWAVRLWPALFGLLGVASTAYLARAMYGRPTGLLAACVLAATPLYFAISQVVILDMPLTALCTLCLVIAWRLYGSEGRGAEPLRLLFWTSLGLAVLTKGPVAVVLVGGTICLYSIVTRKFFWWQRLFSVPGLAAFLVITLPWFVLVSWRNPEFLRFFFLEQHLARYARPWEHQEPVWFYVPVLLLGTLPWWIVAASTWRRSELAARVLGLRWSPATTYLICWFLVVFLFFSFSGSKLGTYILPGLPPLAILIARALTRPPTGGTVLVFRCLFILTMLAGFGTLAAVRLVPLFSSHYRAAMLPPYLALGGTLLLFGAAVVWWAWKHVQRHFPASISALVLVMLVIEVATFAGRSVAQHYTPLAEAIRSHWQAGDRIVLYRHYTQGIPYYTRQRVILVGAWGELDFGQKQSQDDEFFWADDSRMFREWSDGRRMFLVINREELAPIRERFVPKPRELARWGKKLVVVNFP